MGLSGRHRRVLERTRPKWVARVKVTATGLGAVATTFGGVWMGVHGSALWNSTITLSEVGAVALTLAGIFGPTIFNSWLPDREQELIEQAEAAPEWVGNSMNAISRFQAKDDPTPDDIEDLLNGVAREVALAFKFGGREPRAVVYRVDRPELEDAATDAASTDKSVEAFAEKRSLLHVAVGGRQDPVQHSEFMGNEKVGKALLIELVERRPVIIPNTDQASRGIPLDVNEKASYKAFIVFPICDVRKKGRDSVIGALSIDFSEPTGFTDHDRSLGTSLASYFEFGLKAVKDSGEAVTPSEIGKLISDIKAVKSRRSLASDSIDKEVVTNARPSNTTDAQ